MCKMIVSVVWLGMVMVMNGYECIDSLRHYRDPMCNEQLLKNKGKLRIYPN